MPRMKTPNSVEREAFELPPMCNSVERKRNFDFPMAIEQIAAVLRTPTNQLCFLVKGDGPNITNFPTEPIPVEKSRTRTAMYRHTPLQGVRLPY